VLAFFMALTLSAVFPLRTMLGEDPLSYRIPFYPVLPAILIVGALSIVFSSILQRPVEALYGTATVLGGVPVYMFWRRRGSVLDIDGKRPLAREKRR